jgi:cellobiose transport system substrate-binding protein
MMRTIRTTRTAILALLLAAALGAAGCTSTDSSPAASSGKVTLTMDMFGNFGYQEAGLLAEYQRLHSDVTIRYSSIQQESEYWPKVQTKLNAPSSTSDIYGIEVSRIAEVVQNQPDRWVDLKSLGAGGLEQNYYDWKWKSAVNKDGRILGLGTDIGPLAICYRTDLFRQAGLPTDREQLSRMWSSWPAYLDLGRQFKARAPKNVAFVDTASGLYNAILGSAAEQYYDQSGAPIYQTNPAVKAGWDLAVSAIQAGLTARLKQFDPPWNQAFANGSFASVACPSWMIGYIKGQDKNGAGHWDVAKGPGVGNWGGSYLGIPRNSKNQRAAYDLISWLTAPAQQATLFQKMGIFPAAKVAAESPAVAGAKDPYFGDAPIGQIFGTIAGELPLAPVGPKDGQIRDTINNGLLSVDTQGKDPNQAWQQTLRSIKNAIGD